MPAVDDFGTNRNLRNPGQNGEVVTPHNTNEFVKVSRAIYVGTGGNVNLVTRDGTTLLFSNVQDGTVLPIRARQVRATGTTATDIIAIY